MAEFPFLTDVNLHKQQIKQFVVEKFANDTAAGTGVDGQMYYDDTLELIKVWSADDSKWVPIGGGGGSVTGVSGTLPITVDNSTPGVALVEVDDVSASSGGPSSPTGGTPGVIIAVDKEKLDTVEWSAAADQSSDEVPHYNASSATDEGTSDLLSDVETSLNNVGVSIKTHRNKGSNTRSEHNELKLNEKITSTAGIDIPSTPGGALNKWVDEQQVVEYVQSMVTSGGRPAKAFDPNDAAQAGSNNFPLEAYGHGGTIQTGDQFIIDTAGQIGPSGSEEDVYPNDTLIAKVTFTDDTDIGTGTQNPAQWDLIQGQLILDATKTTKGVTQITSTTEMDWIIANPNYDIAMGDDFKYTTAAMIQYYVQRLAGLRWKKGDYAASAKTATLVHDWGNIDVQVSSYISASGVSIHGQVERLTNSVKVTFNIEPVSAWTLMVIGQDLTNVPITP